MRLVLFSLLATAWMTAPAQAQHRGCFGGSCHVGTGYGYSYSSFASPFVVSVPFVPTVSLAVPVAVSAPVVSAPIVASAPLVSAPIVSTFPVATAAPFGVSTGYCSGFTSTPLVFGSTRVFRRHR